MLQSALEYASAGYAVFPLSQNQKIPIKGTSGVKDATKDVNAIRAIWLKHPKSNVGLALGESSGLVAIDLDKGATEETLKKFPRTITVKTKAGWHLYYKYQAGVVNKTVCKESEHGYNATLRSTGYYVVGVGSFVDEHEYHYASDEGGELAPGECELAALPEWIVQAAIKKTYGENSRHEMFKQTAVAMRSKGESQEEILKELYRRNAEDCSPPKENVGPELEAIVTWVFESVPENHAQIEQIQAKKANAKIAHAAAPEKFSRDDDYLIPLGFEDSTYFYTSSSNKQIIEIRASSHRSAENFLQLMPMEFWRARYPKGDEGAVNWQQAASELMGACRDEGVFDRRKIRGRGAWRANGDVVLHLGDRLWKSGKELPLNGMQEEGDRHTYVLQASMPTPHANPLTDAECRDLIDAASCLAWRDPSQALFFAGSMALLRVSGALQWRPMVWLTGGTGSGKSTVTERIVTNIAGDDAVYSLGTTTEAGIRQELGSSSRPVIFDEAETDDKRSNTRMKGVLELIRQASSDSGARIMKGTPDGKGHSFKVNSMFFLSSILVNLTSAQDLNRFTICELGPSDPMGWPSVQSKLAKITAEYGDRLFSRMLKYFDVLQHNQAVLEELIAEITDRRTAQQYSALISGYTLLCSCEKLAISQAKQLVDGMKVIKDIHDGKTDNEQEEECLSWLRSNLITVSIGDSKEQILVDKLIIKATGNEDYRECLNMIGMDVDQEYLYVATKNPEIERIFKDTKWHGALWSRTLNRVSGAKISIKRRMGNSRPRTTAIPLKLLNS